MADATTSQKPGNWVRVLALVVPGQSHPDDLWVEVKTHNSTHTVTVARSHAEPVEDPAGSRCTALRSLSPDTMERCSRSLHGSVGHHWPSAADGEVTGWVEDVT